MKKRFSIRLKLLIIFGFLVITANMSLELLATYISRKAVTEKIEAHLMDKAVDTAEIVNGRISAFLQFLEGLARNPVLRDTSLSFTERAKQLEKETAFNTKIEFFGVCDLNGNRYAPDGSINNISDRDWYQAALTGKNFVAEPRISRGTSNLQIISAVPIYDNDRKIIGVLSSATSGQMLSNDIKDIVVGKTGFCYIIGLTGTMIAHKDHDLVINQENFIEKAKSDPSFNAIANFFKHCLTDKQDVSFYEYQNQSIIASFTKIKTTDWTVVIRAPVGEFMGAIQILRKSMYIIGFIILITALVIIFFTAHAMVKPVITVVNALQNIAQGEGDLTVRLPIHGNDEITDLAAYFNQTIEKIGLSIKTVGGNTHNMETIGSELASNMTETASAVHQISANIDGIKQQALTQAASVTETAATIEEIIRTIKQLNASIDKQSASVALSSSAIEQMVANIASITATLKKTDDVVKTLASATEDGKETIVTSNTVTQKIAEESGSLLEASAVIQHIASQTNLLAMNAAIEAAHAGEAGKGFAVVADEIRKLAEESSMQGKTITTTLKTLSGEIETLSNSSKTAEQKFNVIFNLSDQVKSMSNTLMAAMQEQQHGSHEVLGAIKDINTITSEVQSGSEEMLRGGENVAKEMYKLDGLTRVISDSMNEMAAGAVQISNAIQEVSEISQKNKESIENLVREVNKFKISN